MSDPIDRQDVLRKMESVMDMQELYLPIHFKEWVIDEVPTIDAVPVVRCKNCKNLFSCYKWPTEDILNNFCQDGELGENGYETD